MAFNVNYLLTPNLNRELDNEFEGPLGIGHMCTQFPPGSSKFNEYFFRGGMLGFFMPLFLIALLSHLLLLAVVLI